ncbi:MAG: APC family permease [Gammaproteobacteria bacterium]
MSGKPSHPPLLRVVSRWQIVALSINDVIGSGVYLLPAAAAMLLGSASVLAVPAAGLCVLLVVLCFAEAGSLFDRPGSGYVYTRAAFGELVGFEVGWMTWVARVASAAGLSAGFAQALTAIWPGADTGAGRAAAITVPLLVLTAINIAGVKHGARTAVVLVVGKVLPLLFLIAIGLFAMRWDAFLPVPAPEYESLGEAALLLLFAYAGFENTAAAAGEFKDPRRDVPFALLIMIGTVTVIYTLIQLVSLGLVPNLPESATPLAEAAGGLIGPAGVWLLTIGAVLSILGTNNNTVLAGARYLFALGESRRMPVVFAGVHPRFRTPWIALITQTAVALPLALSGTFVELAALSVIARMATYIGTAAAVPVLRRRMPITPRTVRLPGGPTIPIAALLVCLALLSSAGAKNLIAGAIALAVGAAIYFIGGRRRPFAEA